jgi:hypothetical protein
VNSKKKEWLTEKKEEEEEGEEEGRQQAKTPFFTINKNEQICRIFQKSFNTMVVLFPYHI